MPLTVAPELAASELSAVLHLDHDLAQIGQVRRQARRTLCGWGLDAHADLAELILSELVTNALRYGTGPITARLSYHDGDLGVEVHDNGAGRPARQEVTSDDETGRGLVLLDGLLGLHGGVRGVKADHDGPGKTVYITITITADPAISL